MWFSVFKISTIPVRARKLAMKDAKLKAEDYVSLGQKSRQSCNYDNSKTINHSLLCKDEDNGDG
jgi:hypothetical protein